MMTILIGVFIITMALVSRAKFYHSHGPGLGKYGLPIEPQWIVRLVLVLIGLAAILDGVWEIRHH